MIHDRGEQELRTVRSNSNGSLLRVRRNDTITVLFINCTKMGVVAFRELYASYGTSEHLIMISIKGWTSDVSDSANDAETTVELFSMEELTHNPTRHAYIPLHCVASEAEVAQLMRDTGTDRIAALSKKIPHLLRTDIVCRYYGWPVGTVVRISRTYDIMKQVHAFRVVV